MEDGFDREADVSERGDGAGADPTGTEPSIGDGAAGIDVVGRTNITPAGNRYLPGTVDLTAPPRTVQLPFPAAWVVPLDDGRWAVVSAEGQAAIVEVDDSTTAIDGVDPSGRPLAIADGGEIRLESAAAYVDSDLPDATGVESDSGTTAWFTGATDRLAHGALGDTIEATQLVIVRPSDDTADGGSVPADARRVVVDLTDDPSGAVFEGLSPLIADVDGDGTDDVVATISDGDVGARLVVFDLDGELLAESDPIGSRNRWRHQIAVAPTGPNGSTEIVEVQTPHIGGLLQFHARDGDELALQYQIGTYRSHVLASRNLDGAAVFDADGDGDLDVVIPTQDRDELALVPVIADDAGPDQRIDLGGRTVSSNLALAPAQTGPPGTLRFAIGVDDGRLLVW